MPKQDEKHSYFRPKPIKTFTLWGRAYLYIPYRNWVPPHFSPALPHPALPPPRTSLHVLSSSLFLFNAMQICPINLWSCFFYQQNGCFGVIANESSQTEKKTTQALHCTTFNGVSRISRILGLASYVLLDQTKVGEKVLAQNNIAFVLQLKAGPTRLKAVSSTASNSV